MASLYTVEEEAKIGCFFFLSVTSAFFWTMFILLFQYEYFLNLLQHLDLRMMESSIRIINCLLQQRFLFFRESYPMRNVI